MSWLASPMTAGRSASGWKSTSMLLRRRECSCNWSVRSRRLLRSRDFFCGEAGRENSRRFWTMRAARLAVGQFQLALGGVIGSFALAEKFGNAEDGGQGIVQLMGDAGEHLSHRGEFLRLNKLLLQPLEIGDIAAGENHAFNIALFIG